MRVTQNFSVRTRLILATLRNTTRLMMVFQPLPCVTYQFHAATRALPLLGTWPMVLQMSRDCRRDVPAPSDQDLVTNSVGNLACSEGLLSQLNSRARWVRGLMVRCTDPGSEYACRSRCRCGRQVASDPRGFKVAI
jgi:hypothetical protein